MKKLFFLLDNMFSILSDALKKDQTLILTLDRDQKGDTKGKKAKAKANANANIDGTINLLDESQALQDEK